MSVLRVIVGVALALGGGAALAQSPAAPAKSAKPDKPAKPAFAPPYPQRTDPFRLPDHKAVATRRETMAPQSNLRLKGFVNVGEPRAVVEIDGKLAFLSTGDKRGDIQVLEIAPPSLTLQRGRHRWTESLHDAAGKIAGAR